MIRLWLPTRVKPSAFAVARVDGYVFANLVVVADFKPGRLALVKNVLGSRSSDREPKKNLR